MSTSYLKWDTIDNVSEIHLSMLNDSMVFITDLQVDQSFPNVSTSVISQSTYVIFSILLTMILILGLVQNSLTIYVFLKDKCIRKTHNVFIAALAVSDVAMCVFGVWMVLVSSIFQQWIFGYYGCVYYGFITTAIGLTQIMLLATIALDRYLIIVKPACLKPSGMRSAIQMVTFCYLFGIVWALFPVVGWSSYELEGMRLRCAINWRSKQSTDFSFVLTLLICAWILPLCVILFSYCEIYRRIRKDEKGEVRVKMRRKQKVQNKKKIKTRDKRVALTVLIMIGAFFLSWAPYSVVTLIVFIGHPDDIPVQFSMLPALFAKSSIIWNPIIYVARHREFRRACLRQLAHLGLWRKEVLQVSRNVSVLSRASPTKGDTDVQTNTSVEPVSPVDATTSFVLNTIIEDNKVDV